MIGKVVEKEVTVRTMKVPDAKQHQLQFGFMEGCFSSTCTLDLTEPIAQDKNETLYVTFMDVKEAFDTVW